MLTDHDLDGLPTASAAAANMMHAMGMSRAQLHGFFTLIGFYAGTRRPEEDYMPVIQAVSQTIPTNRDVPIDEQVEDFYEGYELPIGEFMFKWGADVTFEQIPLENSDQTAQLYQIRNFDLFPEGKRAGVKQADHLAAFDELYFPFLEAVGEQTARFPECSLRQSFQCGVLQMQIFGHLDVLAATQTNFYLTDTLPPMIGHFFRGFTQNKLEEVTTLQPLQIAMMGMGVGPNAYMEQYLGYQHQLIEHCADDLAPEAFFECALAQAKSYNDSVKGDLLPLSRSNVKLLDIPIWNEACDSFFLVNGYVKQIWGFDASSAEGLAYWDYKACVAQTIYASLTESKERQH